MLVSGAGIAGLTLAYWLRRRGFEPVVVERAPHGRLGGYGVDFFGSGYDVAARMGILDRLTPHRLPVDAVEFVDASGRSSARLPAELLERVIRGPHLPLMHTTLEGALLDAVDGEVEIRFADSVADVRDTGPAVQGLANRIITRQAFAPVLRRQFGAGSVLPPATTGGR